MEKKKNDKKETSLSDAVRNRCNNYSNNLNQLSVEKRKRIVYGIFIIGLLILICNLFLSHYINKPHNNEETNYNAQLEDSLKMISDEIDEIYDKFGNDSISYDFTLTK